MFSSEFINANFDEFYQLDQEQFPYDNYNAALKEEFGIDYTSTDDAEHFYYYYKDNAYQFVDELADDNFEVKEFIFNKIIETNDNIKAMAEEMNNN